VGDTVDNLVVIWTSGDKEVAKNMAFMYAFNSKLREWWKEVTLVVWGPSAKLLATDEELQGQIKKMLGTGVKVSACKACADNYEVSEELEGLGINVKYMGSPLTKYLKGDCKVLTV